MKPSSKCLEAIREIACWVNQTPQRVCLVLRDIGVLTEEGAEAASRHFDATTEDKGGV